MPRAQCIKSVPADLPTFADVSASFLKKVREVHGDTTATVYRELRAQEAALMQAVNCEYPQAAEQCSIYLTERINAND